MRPVAHVRGCERGRGSWLSALGFRLSAPASWTPSAPVHVAKRALVAVVRKLPRGYGSLDPLRRALLGAYLNLTEAAARDGKERRQRFRCAQAGCHEAAAALGLVPEADAVVGDLDRLAAMLTRLGGLGS